MMPDRQLTPNYWSFRSPNGDGFVRLIAIPPSRVRAKVESQEDLPAVARRLHRAVESELWAKDWEIDLTALGQPSLGIMCVVSGFGERCRKMGMNLSILGNPYPSK